MGSEAEEARYGWRRVTMAGLRGVLNAASSCSPTHRGADGEALWSLRREPRPHRDRDADGSGQATPCPGRVHVIGSSRRG
jgi:hypothetical protein